LDLGSLSHMYLAQVVLFIQTLLIEVMGETWPSLWGKAVTGAKGHFCHVLRLVKSWAEPRVLVGSSGVLIG
jgi:hypothetical protein